MNHRTDAAGGLVGAPIPRKEDMRILTGRTRYIDDVTAPGMLEAAVLRSPVAHARIVRIDTRRALELPGVFDVMTGDEVRAMSHTGHPVIWRVIPGQRLPEHYALAVDKVVYAGQGVAVVAAVDRYVAEDALGLIEVEYEELPVVATLDDALSGEVPPVWGDWGDNVSGRTSITRGDVESAFAEADVIVGATIEYGRQMGLPMETRGAVADWDPYTDTLDLWLSSQAPHLVRDLLGEVLGLPVERVRVRVPDVGGGFGNKFDLHGEEVLAALLSKRSGRPVKLIEDRRESFVATVHSREVRNVVELAATRDGLITGMRGTVYGVMGAVLGMVGSGPAHATATLMTGPYHIPHFDVELVAVMTNRPPAGSYRGWGSPEANYTHERLVELLARKLDIPANEIRRRNLVRADQFPYSAPYYRYDSGQYHRLLALAEQTVEELGWEGRKQAARAEGRRLGIGYSFHVEVTAAGNSRDMNAAGLQHSGFDREVVRVDPTGGVTVYTGQIPMGQGVQTALAQVAADTLGVPVETVSVLTGDTETTPYTGYGSGGSRGAAVAGTALMVAARKLREKILRIAAHLLEADSDDLVIEDGTVRVRGVYERQVTYREIGDAAYRRPLGKLPLDEASTLEESFVYDPPDVLFSYGCSAALVEVDPETGATTASEYVATHDCGVVINPRIVEGQVIGGLAQGLGGALLEEIVYDDQGVPLTDSLRNYLVPLATDVPRVTLRHLSTPSPISPSGMKGIGEGGTIGTAAALTAAVDDALADLGVHPMRIPVTPEYLQSQIGQVS